MTKSYIENRIGQIDAEIAPIVLKSQAISLAGGIAGVVYASKQNKSFLGKFGYFLLGSIATNIVTPFIFSNKLAKLLQEKNQLEEKLRTNDYEL